MNSSSCRIFEVRLQPSKITKNIVNSHYLLAMLWDYIIVGGGLSGSVLSNRLWEGDNGLNILVVEAGPNANADPFVVWTNSTNGIGGEYDWNITSVAQANLDGRNISVPVGKALGGGTVINGGKPPPILSSSSLLTLDLPYKSFACLGYSLQTRNFHLSPNSSQAHGHAATSMTSTFGATLSATNAGATTACFYSWRRPRRSRGQT